MKKPIVIGMLAGILAVGSCIPAMAGTSDRVTSENIVTSGGVMLCESCSIEPGAADILIAGVGDYTSIELNIDEAGQAKLDKLFEEIITLELAQKHEEAQKKWAEYDSVIRIYIEYPSFEEYCKGLIDYSKISNTDLTAAEKLYQEAVAFEKDGQYKDADAKWDAMWDIIGEYSVVETSEFLETLIDSGMELDIPEGDIIILEDSDLK